MSPFKYLCDIDDLPESGCREFMVDEQPLFAVRQGSQLAVYINSCPHVGTPLNWKPDQFLSKEGNYIQCYSHGALFEIDTGLCVAGPCSGESLIAVPHQVKDDGLYVAYSGRGAILR